MKKRKEKVIVSTQSILKIISSESSALAGHNEPPVYFIITASISQGGQHIHHSHPGSASDKETAAVSETAKD